MINRICCLFACSEVPYAAYICKMLGTSAPKCRCAASSYHALSSSRHAPNLDIDIRGAREDERSFISIIRHPHCISNIPRSLHWTSPSAPVTINSIQHVVQLTSPRRLSTLSVHARLHCPASDFRCQQAAPPSLPVRLFCSLVLASPAALSRSSTFRPIHTHDRTAPYYQVLQSKR